jgi:predicted transport protein
VILEYKRSVGESVITQGLFYLNWLMDHQAEFNVLAMEKLGRDVTALIDWSAPRLMCIAADFTRYDTHAVQQINRSIELIRYRRFGVDLLLLELVNAVSPAKARASKTEKPVALVTKGSAVNGDKSYAEWLSLLSVPMLELLTLLEDFIGSLGDDVQRKELKLYVAFKRLKNFATIVPQKNRLLLFLHLNPDSLNPLPVNTRDARHFGHWGTGDLEFSIASFADMELAKPLISSAYEGRAS